jgi:uncharacterized repeat protein (TIGR01451 family)
MIKKSNAGGAVQEEADQDLVNEREDWFYSRRTAGNPDFSVPQAAAARAKAADDLINLKNTLKPQTPSAFSGAWSPRGPDPIVQFDRSYSLYHAVSGRIGALAIRSSAPYTMYLGAAQGGVWVSTDPTTNGWEPKTDQLGSLAIGAIALAPSNEDIVYVGTGEGALSGDSYFGNGVLKSTDGGNTFVHVSGTFFNQVSISKIVVDPTNANHLYAGTLRGRGGARRVSPPYPSFFGVWESTDGGVSWILRYKTSAQGTSFGGVTDMAMDPLQPNVIYAATLGDSILKTVDGGLTWSTAMNGLPSNALYWAAPTRFALGISHPSAAISATLYTGFEWYDDNFDYHYSNVWKSTDEAQNWAPVADDGAQGYCNQGPENPNSQCWYDNVIAVDPISPTIVYALGLWSYDSSSDGVGDTNGGVYRSMDGGASWVNLGYGLHPDFHAFAIRNDAPGNIVIGNDGGVWLSTNYGGRVGAGETYTMVDWIDLNGDVDPDTSTLNASYGLQIAQFSSIANNPNRTTRLYGGTQDNGTLRKIGANNGWIDYASGDGGQVIVDPIDPSFVYGTYYGINPYRFSEGMLSGFYGGQVNVSIRSGINTGDRSEFYVPFIMDPDVHTRLYLGTYRVYRTDNQGTRWSLISPDLTGGCGGTAPNGARGCVIGALAATAGGDFVWVGTLDGYVWIGSNTSTASPTWTRVDAAPLPNRPVSSIAVDRSNYRVAYVTYGGFNVATPTTPGHIFKTTDAGATWTDISGTLFDSPINSVVLDPSYPNTLYIGTDVGPMVTNNLGGLWLPLGTGFPIVTINQLDLNPFKRQLAAGTHGRGAWTMIDGTAAPALQVRKNAVDKPIGPNQLLTYTITIKNWGNAAASSVAITDPLPANVTFVSADNGGSLVGNNVVWTSLSAPLGTNTNAGTGAVSPGSVAVNFTVLTTSTLQAGDIITDDGIIVSSAEVAPIYGSPLYTPIAPAAAVLLTPASQTDGTNNGQVITYTVTAKNLSFNTDSYNLATSGNAWTTTFWDATDTTPITQTPAVAPADSTSFVVHVTVSPAATNNMTDAVSIAATSVLNPAVNAHASITTIAVNALVLLVDNDDNAPNAAPYYKSVMDMTGLPYNYWATRNNPVSLPPNYMKAHKAIVWWTGGAFPGPFTPYEAKLTSYLDNGGRLFMTSLDGLDSGGFTTFVQTYLHTTWTSSLDNDKSTDPMTVTAFVTNSVSSVLVGNFIVNNGDYGYGPYNDFLHPTGTALPAFMDVGANEVNGLSATDNSGTTGKEYRVVFLAFPPEAMGTITDGVTLMNSVMDYFGVQGLSPDSVSISGPASGMLGHNYDFTSPVTPFSTTQPIMYTWQATDLSNVIHTGGGPSDMVTFNWPITGTKSITVTADNGFGSTTYTTQITIDYLKTYLPLVMK